MAEKLVRIRVKIGLRANGHADHPDWSKVPMCFTSDDMRKYCPQSWLYDKVSGHQTETLDSPIGQQFGYLLGTRAFVDQAIATFPELITELTEAEFETIFNTRVMGHIPENKYDQQVLAGLQIELSLKEAIAQDTTALKVKIAKAIDPEDAEAGIKKNKEKKWSDFKVNKGIEIETK